MPTSTIENYLKAIHRRSQEAAPGDWVSLGKIAEDISVTPGTVTTMVKSMAETGLVNYRSRRGAQLTDKGSQAALNVIRRHRLIELFLVKIMNMNWGDVHKEAEILEHVVSEVLIQRMDEMLGHPPFDPHGAPIPNAEGEMERQDAQLLADCKPGTYEVARVAEASAEFLGWLASHGLVPGAEIRLQHSDPLGGTLTLACGRQDALSIGVRAAEQIWVVPAREAGS